MDLDPYLTDAAVKDDAVRIARSIQKFAARKGLESEGDYRFSMQFQYGLGLFHSSFSYTDSDGPAIGDEATSDLAVEILELHL